MKSIIEVVYASTQAQACLTVQMPLGATAREAIHQSGILNAFPDIDLEKNKIGIFGEFITLCHVLRDRDRIEIYRPLSIDPKQARLRRVKQTREENTSHL